MRATKTDLIYIALGSNLGFKELDSAQILSNAVKHINSIYSVIAVSSKYLSPAWPKDSNAPDYHNMVIAIKGPRSPFALMKRLLGIEKQFGRIRKHGERNAPRSLDLDIIDFKSVTLNEVRNSIHLTLPHPRLRDRDFVLLPLFEISPDWVFPNEGKNINCLINEYKSQNQELTAKMCYDY